MTAAGNWSNVAPNADREGRKAAMRALARGTKGDDVARLQALLCLSGFDAKPIDGDFGGGTERAVKACQANRGLPATGAAKEDTQKAVGMDEPDVTRTPVPVCDRMSVDLVARMFSPLTPRTNIEKYLPPVLRAFADAGMDDRDLVLMGLATIRAETEGFEPIDEKVSRFNSSDPADPSKRFDLYAGRLGNRDRADAERYRGRGFVQLTGRDNYRTYADRLGVPLLDVPERANDPETASRILAAFIGDKRSRAKYAILGHDLATARKLVNGGRHGLDRFTKAFVAGEWLLA
jgi:peptidoglycan L-alanyl-D-glutamate endopeptidase CwlK